VKDNDGTEASAGIIVYENGWKPVNLACENNASISAEAYEAMPKEDYKIVPLIDSVHDYGTSVSESHKERLQMIIVSKSKGSGGSKTDSPNTKIFDGEWGSAVASNGTFSISLRQTVSRIIGQYCAIAKNGNKIDCDPENNPNITGVVNGHSGVASLTFSSFFGATTGKATIVRGNGQLIWHVVEAPQGGESYAPLNAILQRN
jgi:hypothetical protein